MKGKNVDILAFGAHPDDIELGCCGTLLKHKELGYSFGLCDLTQGELGTRGSGPLRLIEAEKSSVIMGASWRINLGFKDGLFAYNEENLMQIIKVIRLAQPKIVFANATDDRHPDHGRAAKLVADACFYSGLAKIEVFDDNGVKIPQFRPKTVLHYIQDKEIPYDFVYDITSAIDKKIECIQAFDSQFFVGDNSGPKTPISSEQFLNFLKAKNSVYGRDIQVDYAEAFIAVRKHSINNLMNLI